MEFTINSQKYGTVTVLVDDEDWPLVSRYTWHYHGGTGYVRTNVTTIDGPKTILLHRLIMPGVEILDHINCNPLDNRKSNLRPATKEENARNRRKTTSPALSRFKGVTKVGNRWQARIQAYGKETGYLGMFGSEYAAAMAYDNAAHKAFGEFANLNFPNLRALNATVTVIKTSTETFRLAA